MTARSYMLAIDLGTSGPKVALVGDDGSTASRSFRPVSTLTVEGGGAEQAPQEIWDAVLGACREVLTAAPQAAAAVRGVICESHYFSLIPVDRSGEAVGPCVLWLDERGGPHTMEFYGRHPEAVSKWLTVHGLPPLPSGNDSLSHMFYFRAECPDIVERTHAFVEPMDFLAAKFTGVVAANPCTVYPLLLTDNRDLDRVDYDPELLGLAGIDQDKLPPLVPASGAVAPILDEVAADLGLPQGTELFAGINDTQSVAVGAGTFLPGRGGINIGTTTQVLAHVPAMGSDVENAVLSIPSGLPGRYMALAENGLGGKLLEHFVHNVIFAEDVLADHSTEDAYAKLEDVLVSEATGSGGVIYLPWLTGTQTPLTDGDARGAFLNISLATTRTAMLRAIVEGISMNMRWALGPVEAMAGGRFEELRFSGGGAISDAWSQTLADVMGRPVLQVDDARFLGARATAFLGFLQAGSVALDDVDKFCPIKRRYEPIPENARMFDRYFEHFVASYERNRPLFHALNSGAENGETGDVAALIASSLEEAGS